MADMSLKLKDEIIPNTFPFPNVYIDSGIFAALKTDEQAALTALLRKTFGWWKRSDRVSHSQIAAMTGMSEQTAKRCMDALAEFGIVERLTDGKDGLPIEYKPQVDKDKINIAALNERKAKRAAEYQLRMRKARAGIPPPVSQYPPCDTDPHPPCDTDPHPPCDTDPTKLNKPSQLKTTIKKARQKTPRPSKPEKPFVYPKGMAEYAYAFEKIIGREAHDDNERKLWAFGLPKQGIHGFSDYLRDGITPSHLLKGYKIFLQQNKKQIPVTRPHTLYNFALQAKRQQGQELTADDVRRRQQYQQSKEVLN